jgi:thiamine pyrophosphokinase
MGGGGVKVVVVANGDPAPTDVEHLADAAFVIAADGGARWLDGLHRVPDLVVGDLDSLDSLLLDRLRAAGASVERHPAAKDASDLELAVSRALEMGADEIVVLGAIGGQRLDHALANLLLLVAPGPAGRVRIVQGATQVRVVRGGERLELGGALGDVVTLLPIGGDGEGVVTDGLRYRLSGETLEFGRSRGLSNEIVHRTAAVSINRGTLLVLHRKKGAEA